MELVILIVLGAAAFWWMNVRRGRRFVRAFAFLDHLDLGDDVATANRCVSSMVFTRYSDPDADRTLMVRALGFAAQHTDGRQLPIIALARAKGFAG
jgi:hypothetical protein